MLWQRGSYGLMASLPSAPLEKTTFGQDAWWGRVGRGVMGLWGQGWGWDWG